MKTKDWNEASTDPTRGQEGREYGHLPTPLSRVYASRTVRGEISVVLSYPVCGAS